MGAKNVHVVVSLLMLSVFTACKLANNGSKTKGSDVTSCYSIQARITQAEADLKSRNAPIPADTSGSSPQPAPSQYSDASGDFGLTGSRNCGAEATATWTNCMIQKCAAYNKTLYFYSAIDCTSNAAINAAVASGKINDRDASCAKVQGFAQQSCDQQNSTQQPLEYVCVSRTGSDGKPLNQWRLKSEALANGDPFIATHTKTVYPGNDSAQALNNAECGNLVSPEKSNNNPNDINNIKSAQTAQDIERFTQNLNKARAEYKNCIANANSQKSSAQSRCQTANGRFEEEDGQCYCLDGKVLTTGSCTAQASTAPNASPTACPSGQVHDGKACVSNYSQCKDNYYMGNDGRCYPKAERACTSSEYLAVDGKCYPLGGDKQKGDKTSCLHGEILTSLGNCEPDSKYSGFDGNYQ